MGWWKYTVAGQESEIALSSGDDTTVVVGSSRGTQHCRHSTRSLQHGSESEKVKHCAVSYYGVNEARSKMNPYDHALTALSREQRRRLIAAGNIGRPEVQHIELVSDVQ